MDTPRFAEDPKPAPVWTWDFTTLGLPTNAIFSRESTVADSDLMLSLALADEARRRDEMDELNGTLISMAIYDTPGHLIEAAFYAGCFTDEEIRELSR